MAVAVYGLVLRWTEAKMRGDIVSRGGLRVKLVAIAHHAVLLHAAGRAAAAAAPVVPRHGGAVLPGVAADRRRRGLTVWSSARSGQRCRRCPLAIALASVAMGAAARSHPRAGAARTLAASTSVATRTRWGCWSARRWRLLCRGAPGSGPAPGARARSAVAPVRAGFTGVPASARALVVLVVALSRVDEFSVGCIAGASWRCLLVPLSSSVRSRPGPAARATVLGAPILRGVGERSYGSTCGTGRCSC